MWWFSQFLLDYFIGRSSLNSYTSPNPNPKPKPSHFFSHCQQTLILWAPTWLLLSLSFIRNQTQHSKMIATTINDWHKHLNETRALPHICNFTTLLMPATIFTALQEQVKINNKGHGGQTYGASSLPWVLWMKHISLDRPLMQSLLILDILLPPKGLLISP